MSTEAVDLEKEAAAHFISATSELRDVSSQLPNADAGRSGRVPCKLPDLAPAKVRTPSAPASLLTAGQSPHFASRTESAAAAALGARLSQRSRRRRWSAAIAPGADTAQCIAGRAASTSLVCFCGMGDCHWHGVWN
eukprot:gb/GFBE01022473.1/.p1 GENE.gb/GFBE01022473.1/~~gb/GFBE01022473.1/.p1  ORF type:complete len:136 (+),score=15.19 gb/GFBE01022473.1/:1-408(+)